MVKCGIGLYYWLLFSFFLYPTVLLGPRFLPLSPFVVLVSHFKWSGSKHHLSQDSSSPRVSLAIVGEFYSSCRPYHVRLVRPSFASCGSHSSSFWVSTLEKKPWSSDPTCWHLEIWDLKVFIHVFIIKLRSSELFNFTFQNLNTLKT